MDAAAEVVQEAEAEEVVVEGVGEDSKLQKGEAYEKLRRSSTGEQRDSTAFHMPNIDRRIAVLCISGAEHSNG